MTERKFAQLLSTIDPALIAEAEASVPLRQKPIFKRALIAAVAAMLALSLLLGAAAIAFIPKTYDLDYEIPKQENASKVTQIYYLSENSKIKRQSVLLPPTEQNVFMTWKHLNGLGDEVQMLDVVYEDVANWSGSYITVQLSAALRDHPNSEALLDSLQKTLARSFGVMKQNVSFFFNDTVSSPLQFYHSLQLQSATVALGGTLEITVGMTNVSDQDIVFEGAWSDFVPKAKLRADSTIYVEQLLLPLPNDSTTEIAEYRLAPGESREVTYTFDIPENAELGYYDLILSFGDAKMTFESAVEVVVLTVPDIGTFTINMPEFEKFMQENYLEDTTVYEALRTFYGYTHQGQMIDYDEIIRGDLVNGGTSEKAFHSLFAYDYSGPTNRAEGVCSYAYFTGKAIPDSLAPFDQDPKAFALPCGITEQDPLQQALCKMGMSEAVAMMLLDNPTSLTLAGSNSKNLSFMVSEEGDQYAIRYQTSVTIYAQDNLAETTTRSLILEYDANGKFVQFTIEVRTELSASGKYYGDVAFTRYHGGYQVNWQFDEEQRNWFLNLLNNGTWLEGTPIYSDFTLEPTIRVGNHSLLYVENFLMDGNTYMELSNEQWGQLGNITQGFPFFQRGPIRVTKVGDSDTRTLNDQEFHQLLVILNRNTWNHGTPGFDYDYEIEIAGQMYYYDSSASLIWGDDKCLFLLTEADQVIAQSVICNKNLIYFERNATVRVDSPYDDSKHYATLSDEYRNQIISILNGGEWKTGVFDVPADYYDFRVSDSFAEYEILYSPEEGIFLFDDCYLRISNEDMNTVDEIVRGYTVEMPHT